MDQNFLPSSIRIFRLDEVLKIFPVSRSTWYEGIKRGTYPAPIQLSPRRVGWEEPAIIELQQRLSTQARDRSGLLNPQRSS